MTPKQQRFVEEYMIDLNATRAAIRAGYSARTAQEQGSRLLSNVMVAKAVEQAAGARAQSTGVTAERVLQELSRLAFADIRKVFDEEGRLRPVSDLPIEIAASISSIEVVTTRIPGSDPVEVEYTAKMKFWDKRSSLELLGKHLKMFTDKIEASGPNGGPVNVQVYLPDNGRNR